MVCLGPESGCLDWQRHPGDAWADSGEHFHIASFFEETLSVFSHSQLRNGGTHCNGTLDINGCIEIKKGVD